MECEGTNHKTILNPFLVVLTWEKQLLHEDGFAECINELELQLVRYVWTSQDITRDFPDARISEFVLNHTS